MKKVAILLENFIEEVEFIYPYYRLKEEGWKVEIIAPEIKEYKGKNGLKFKPDKSIEETKAENYDALFIPGGYAPDRWRRNKKIIEFVRKMYQANKPIAAICHGPWLLISAGIVKNKKVTGFFSIAEDLKNAGAIYTNKPFEKDGNILTATDPKSMPLLLKEFIKTIKDLK